MHFYCTCGYRISDTTDFLSYKAYMLADQDQDDFFDGMEKLIKDDSLSREECAERVVIRHANDYLKRNIYQCPQCGRIFIEDNEENGFKLHIFAPEGDVNKKLLTSAKDTKWKGFLHAEWNDKKFEWRESHGYIFVNTNVPHDEDLSFDDKEAFWKRYYELFEELKAEKLIRSALLIENDKWLHSWSDND